MWGLLTSSTLIVVQGVIGPPTALIDACLTDSSSAPIAVTFRACDIDGSGGVHPHVLAARLRVPGSVLFYCPVHPFPLVLETRPYTLEVQRRSMEGNGAGVRFVVDIFAMVLGVALQNLLLPILFRLARPAAIASCGACLKVLRQWHLGYTHAAAACGSSLATLKRRPNDALQHRVCSPPWGTGLRTCRASLVCILALSGVRLSDAALPAGCTANAGTLTSCTAFAGGATLSLSSQSLTAVQSGAFAGLSSVTTL
jgi:hypothetical protein